MDEIRLPYTELTVGGKNYMLRLTALSAVRLEERLGMSVYAALGKTDEMKVLCELVFALVESLRPEFTKHDAYSLIDDFVSEGGTLAALANAVAEALKASGFFGEASVALQSS